MTDREIEVPMQQGSSDSVFYCPEGDGSWPGVLYLTDIAGIRTANREAAARLSKQGYAVLMPNIFYRTGRAPLQPSFRTLEPEAMKKRMAELSTPLTLEAMQRDTSTYIDFLESQICTRKSMIGVVGYCFSGKMAMYAAAARPDKVDVYKRQAHGPFVHQAWWWRSRHSMHEKQKNFEPIPNGFRMSAHTPSSNSAPYKLLRLYAAADSITTTIDFVLPNLRRETIRAGTVSYTHLDVYKRQALRVFTKA